MWAWLSVFLLVPLLAGLAVVCLRRPMHVALPIFAALVPFGKGISIAPTSFGSASSLAGLLLGAGLVLQLALGDRRAAPRLSGGVAVWLAFLATAGATVLWSVKPSVTANGFAVLASLVLLFVVTSMSAVDRVVLRRTENGLLLGGVAAVAYGLYQLLLLGGFPSDRPGAGIVPDGRFGNDLVGPNILALSLLLPLVIAVRRAAGNDHSRAARAFHAWLAALLLLGVLMTASRSGTVAVGVALVALAIASPGGVRRRLWVGLAAVTVVVAGVWALQPGGITSRTFESAASTSGRADIWRVGLAACAEHCAYGSGWGTFPGVYAETQATVAQARVLVGDQGTYQPHNLLLLSLIELGLLGALLLMAGLLVGVVEAWRLPASLRGPPLAAIAGLLVALQFLSSMEFKIFWMVVIYVVMNRNLVDAEQLGRVRVRGALRDRSGMRGVSAG
jgi:O-antigen ligase